MTKTAQSVWENCLVFIKDNIQDQAYKTWFEPIRAVELTDSALYIQVRGSGPPDLLYANLSEEFAVISERDLFGFCFPWQRFLSLRHRSSYDSKASKRQKKNEC